MATYPTSKTTLTAPHEDWRNKVPVKKETVEDKAPKKTSKKHKDDDVDDDEKATVRMTKKSHEA